MMVRFKMSKRSEGAKSMASRLKEDSFCPLGGPEGLVGFVRSVEESAGRTVVLAEIIEPDMAAEIARKYGSAEPVDIDLDKMSMSIPLFNYMQERFTRPLTPPASVEAAR